MYYVMIEAVPLEDNFEKLLYIGAYVNCWVNVDSLENAVEEAKRYAVEQGWRCIKIEDISVVDRERYEDDAEVLEAFDEAKVDGIAGIFYTFDNEDE